MSLTDQRIATHTPSPIECGKKLDEMNDAKAQLIFLVSMKPDQVISTLACAEEKTRNSILNRIPELSRREMSRHIAAFQATTYQPFSKIPEELVLMILENLIPGIEEEWNENDFRTISSVLLTCWRWYAITLPLLDRFYIYLDVGPHSLSARMASGPTNAELSEPSFCYCYREYCGCVKSKTNHIRPLWAIKGSQTPCRLTLHMKAGPGTRYALPHFKVLETAVALLDRHKISQVEIEVIIWTTIEEAKYTFTRYTGGLHGTIYQCWEVCLGRINKIVRIVFKGPGIQFEYTIPYSDEIPRNMGGPWSFMDFQKFVSWHHMVSDALSNPRRNYAVLEALHYDLSESLQALEDIEDTDFDMRPQIGLARKLGLTLKPKSANNLPPA
jgi:hypothetical protein